MGKPSVNTNSSKIDQNSTLIPSFQQLIDTALEGVWVIDKQGITTYVNASLCNALGYSESEILNHPVTKLFFKEDLKDHEQRMLDRKNG